eukprot:m51a1_g9246 putative dna-directed dna polymerase (1366) ;mRNA; r:1840-7583
MSRDSRRPEPLLSVDYSSLTSRRIGQLEDELVKSRDEIAALRQRLDGRYGDRDQRTRPTASSDIDDVYRELHATQNELHELRKRTAQAVGELRGGSNGSVSTRELADELIRTQDEMHELRKRVGQAFASVQRQLGGSDAIGGGALAEEVARVQEELLELRRKFVQLTGDIRKGTSSSHRSQLAGAPITPRSRCLSMDSPRDSPRGFFSPRDSRSESRGSRPMKEPRGTATTVESLAAELRATQQDVCELAKRVDAGAGEDEIFKVQEELHELRKRTAQAVCDIRSRLPEGEGGVCDSDIAGEVDGTRMEVHELRKRIAQMLGPSRDGEPNKIVGLEEEIERSRDEMHMLRQRIGSVLAPKEGQSGGNRIDAIEEELFKTQDELHALRERVAQAVMDLRNNKVDKTEVIKASLSRGHRCPSEPVEEPSYKSSKSYARAAQEEDEATPGSPPHTYEEEPIGVEDLDRASAPSAAKRPVVPRMKSVPRVRPPSAGVSFAAPTPRSARMTPRSLALEGRIQAAESDIQNLLLTFKSIERSLGGKADASSLQTALSALQRENRQLQSAISNDDVLSDKLEQMSSEVTSKVEDLRARIEMLGRDVREGQREILTRNALAMTVPVQTIQPIQTSIYEQGPQPGASYPSSLGPASSMPTAMGSGIPAGGMTSASAVQPTFSPSIPQRFAAAAEGQPAVLGDLKDAPRFVALHSSLFFVAHGAAQVFLAIDEQANQTTSSAREELWEIANSGRLRDVSLLDMLVRLAKSGDKPEARTLDVLCREYHICVVEPDAATGAQLPRDLQQVSTLVPLYRALADDAARLAEAFSDEPLPCAQEKYGLLSEVVKGAIALEQLSRNGIFVDRERLQRMSLRVRADLQGCVERLLAMPQYSVRLPDRSQRLLLTLAQRVFARDAGGQLLGTEGALRPAIDTGALRELLVAAAGEIDVEKGLAVPKTASGDVETSIWKWKNFCAFHPFIQTCGVEAEIRSAGDQFAVFPQYSPMTRNGRASCRAPNIQTTPSTQGFREIFVAPRGYTFLIVDYRCIELCTLAAVCESRYGFSALSDVIKGGKDPHAFTASFFAKLTYEEFVALKTSPSEEDRKKYAEFRQKAKAINFGIPAGWSPQSLREYALSNYGVEMSIVEARQFREQLVSDIYPELGLYLYEDSIQLISRSLGVPLHDAWEELWGHKKTHRVAAAIRSVIKGKYERADGTTYERGFVDRVLGGLQVLASRPGSKVSPEVLELIREAREARDDPQRRRAVGAKLHEALFKGACLTLTGRIRGAATFTKARNTPFSGLAADGAKLAMFHLSCFVHDEFVITVAKSSNIAAKKRLVERIVCESMQELTGSVPISCSCGVSDSWTKEPKPVED